MIRRGIGVILVLAGLFCAVGAVAAMQDHKRIKGVPAQYFWGGGALVGIVLGGALAMRKKAVS
ncbi:MAG TPA: hypothetical protein VFF73_36880 [Planctomycetota bacterium]|nr:hypothetical protein [Planctomycetota bacterium]